MYRYDILDCIIFKNKDKNEEYKKVVCGSQRDFYDKCGNDIEKIITILLLSLNIFEKLNIKKNVSEDIFFNLLCCIFSESNYPTGNFDRDTTKPFFLAILKNYHLIDFNDDDVIKIDKDYIKNNFYINDLYYKIFF